MLGKMLALAQIVAAVGALAQPTVQNVIHVDVAGLRNDKGQVMCALYSSAEGFPKDGNKALKQVKAPISNGHATCDFSGIGPGTYAVAVFHDENANGKMDTNFVGMPREGVGASNDAQGHFGPPPFDKAAFRFTGGRMDLKINVRYL
jgi:uncharacterized protein (DUF2141 family)